MTEQEKINQRRATQRAYYARKKEEKVTKVIAPETVSKVVFDSLQQSFIEKCKQYEALFAAYKSLQIRINANGEAAKQFMRTASIGLELLFPTQDKGGQN